MTKGPRNITIKQIEAEVNKSPLTKVTNSGKSYSGKDGIVIEGFDFSVDNKDVKMLNVTDCKNVTIRRCKFSGKKLIDVALNITGEKTKNVIVEYCIFENMDTDLDNGGEPLRLGNSQYSGCVYDSIVRKCIFRNLTADPETISIKSVGNIVEDNFFIENECNVTVRHGGIAKIRNNSFKGKGGIRLMGYNNVVYDNVFEDNPGDPEKFSPIVIGYAVQAKDPNWNKVNEPSGKAGSSHAIYAQNVDNEIYGNRFNKNCKITLFYRKDKSLAPKGLKLEDNLRVNSIDPTDETSPDPIGEPPIPEDKPEPNIPPQPEEDPTTEPVDEEHEPYAHLCQGCGKNEGKIKVVFFVCSRDSALAQKVHKESIHKLRSEIAAQQNREDD